VERSAVGRRAVDVVDALFPPLVSLLLLTDESPLSAEAAMLPCRAAEVGVGVLVDEGGMGKEAAEMCREVGTAADDDEEVAVVVGGVADDCERWRTAISAGLWRRSWLLDERWPGV
jgi:hypothetical protein